MQGALVAMAQRLGLPPEQAVGLVHRALRQHTQGAIIASAQHMREVRSLACTAALPPHSRPVRGRGAAEGPGQPARAAGTARAQVGNREGMQQHARAHVTNLMRVHKAVPLPAEDADMAGAYIDLALSLAHHTYAIERTVMWESITAIYPSDDASKPALKLLLQAH